MELELDTRSLGQAQQNGRSCDRSPRRFLEFDALELQQSTFVFLANTIGRSLPCIDEAQGNNHSMSVRDFRDLHILEAKVGAQRASRMFSPVSDENDSSGPPE